MDNLSRNGLRAVRDDSKAEPGRLDPGMVVIFFDQ